MAAPPVNAPRGKGDEELRDWMGKRREHCEVWESAPSKQDLEDEVPADGISTASTTLSSQDRLLAGGHVAHVVLEEQAAAGEASRRRNPRSDEDVLDWMAQIRRRCHVLENTPSGAVADFQSDLRGGDQELPPTLAHIGPLSASALREGLQDGPLSHADRARLWPALMASTDSSTENDKFLTATPSALTELLRETLPKGPVEGISPRALARTLASLFTRKYLSFLEHQSLLTDEGGTDRRRSDKKTFQALAQLLRYHAPRLAGDFRNAGKSRGYDVPSALHAACNSCGMPVMWSEMLFELPDDEAFFEQDGAQRKEALLLLCDALVLSGLESLLLFVVLALLLELPVAIESADPAYEWEELEEWFRGALSLQAVADRSPSEVCTLVAAATFLWEATPASLRSAVAPDGRKGAELQSPVCTVSPEEVLQHTHSGSPGAWRLFVVDARMRCTALQLPVCFALPKARHNERRKVLEDFPHDQAVHICLVGDNPPASGDDAYELALYLTSKYVGRKHVSLVEGGWPAVEELARARDLDLLSVVTEEEALCVKHSSHFTKEVGAFSEQAPADLKLDALAEGARGAKVAETVAHAKSTVVAASTSITEMAWGAGHYLSALLEYADGGPGAGGAAAPGDAGVEKAAGTVVESAEKVSDKPSAATTAGCTWSSDGLEEARHILDGDDEDLASPRIPG